MELTSECGQECFVSWLRSIPESEAYAALQVIYGNTLAAFTMHSIKFDCHEYVQRKFVLAARTKEHSSCVLRAEIN